MIGPWRIELFGRLRLRQEEREITRFQTERTAALLAYLAYHLGQAHPRPEVDHGETLDPAGIRDIPFILDPAAELSRLAGMLPHPDCYTIRTLPAQREEEAARRRSDQLPFELVERQDAPQWGSAANIAAYLATIGTLREPKWFDWWRPH